MVCFVFENCGKRVGIQPWWRKDICASLAFEQQGEPERHIGSMRWIQRSYRSLWIDQHHGTIRDAV